MKEHVRITSLKLGKFENVWMNYKFPDVAKTQTNVSIQLKSNRPTKNTQTL